MRRILFIVSLSSIALCGCDAPPAPQAVQALAPYKTVLTMKQLMNWVVDPNAQALWASVGTIVTAEGTQEIAPASDEEWTRLRNDAAVLAESGNLLMMDGRALNRSDWMMKSRRLIDTANEARKAIDAKDVEALFVAGGNLYQACSDCHSQYMLANKPMAAE